MALKMIHLLAYKCEDGMLISIHENHVDRDRDWEAAQEEWRKLEGTGEAPCARFDTFALEGMTTEELHRMIRRVMMKLSILQLIRDIIS